MSSGLPEVAHQLWGLAVLFVAIAITFGVDREKLRIYEHGARWRLFFMSPWDVFILLNVFGRVFYVAAFVSATVSIVLIFSG